MSACPKPDPIHENMHGDVGMYTHVYSRENKQWSDLISGGSSKTKKQRLKSIQFRTLLSQAIAVASCVL